MPFFRYAPETDFSNIRGKEIIVSGEFSSDAVAASTGKFIQEFHVNSAADEETGKALKEIEEKDIFVFSDTEFEAGRQYEIAVKIGRDNRKFNPGMAENNNLYANLIEVKDLRGGKKVYGQCLKMQGQDLADMLQRTLALIQARLFLP